MPSTPPILTADRGKAHSVALAILCVLAVVQIIAVGRAVWLSKSPAAATRSATAGQPQSTPGAYLSPPAPGTISSPTTGLMPPPAIPAVGSSSIVPPPPPAFTGIASAPARELAPPPLAPALPSTPLSSAAPSIPKPATNPADAEVLEQVDVATQLRSLGDLQGALEMLRRADVRAPDHPAVLLETAQTYDEMGLTDKALTAWRKIEAMGAAKAGAAHSQALQRLSGATGAAIGSGPDASLSPATGLTTPAARPFDASKTLSLGTCQVVRDPAVTKGERLTLRVPIRSQPDQPIDPGAVDIDVFFFDLVNEEKVEQTKADVPVSTWAEAPVDWQSGQEMLDVVYAMPEMTPEGIRSHGRRKYHGFIVKLYYQSKLQDIMAEPASLQNFGAAGSQPTGAVHPLLPPVTK